jgi:rhodanese-related sulfurtransferase
MASFSLLKSVTGEAIFNLPLYEHYLVIDARTVEEYQNGHIATAVSYPCTIPADERETALVRFAMNYSKEFYKPENPNPLVIYGSNYSSIEMEHIDWLAGKLMALKRQRNSLVSYSPEEREIEVEEEEVGIEDPYESFCQTVIDKVQEIWLLSGGYEAFLIDYPYLCGDVKFEDMFPLPHQIMRGVFVGSRVVPTSSTALNTMRITHMIVSDHQEISHLSNVNNVMILRCNIRDSNDEKMVPCWEACCHFIDQALISGGNVLIMVHGRSRSSSVALAYLIRKTGVGFESAWQQLRSKCWHLIDRSLVYEPQLHEWARIQTHALPER